MNAIETWLVNLTGETYLWITELFLIVFAVLFAGFLLNRIFDRLQLRAAESPTVWDDAFLEACRSPAIWLIWILGINFALSITAQRIDSPLQDFIQPMNRLALIVLCVLFINGFIRRVERNLLDPLYMSKPMDATTVKAISKLFRAAVVITAILVIMQFLGYSISGLLAFGGIGGIAVGFATNILNRNPKDVIDACLAVLSNKRIKTLSPWLSEFNGTFTRNPENPNTWKISGSYEVLNTNTVKVTEIPPNFTYERYEEHLNNLVEKRIINSYEDNSSDKIEYILKFQRAILKQYITKNKLDNLLKI